MFLKFEVVLINIITFLLLIYKKNRILFSSRDTTRKTLGEFEV